MRTLLTLCTLLAAVSCKSDRAAGPDAASRDASLDRDAASLASAPGATGNLHGFIAGLPDADSARGVVSAAGESQALASAYFFLARVPAGEAVSVFVRVPGYSLGHARAAVRPNQTSEVLLRVTPLEAQPLGDATAGQTLRFGDYSLTLPSAGLAPVYGGPVRGTVTVTAARLDAASAPGGLWLGAQHKRFAARAVIELRASQPGAALTLTQPAMLGLPLEAAPAGLQSYRFDEAQGSWKQLAAATFDVAQRRVQLPIDGFGVYAIGTTLTDLGCARVSLLDGADHPVPNAAIRFATADGTEADQVWTDATGHACLAATPNATLRLQSLAQVDGRVLTSQAELRASAAAMGCSASCSETKVSTAPAAVRCVRGQLSDNGTALPIELFAVEADGSETGAGKLLPGNDFCIDFASASQLRFASSLHCPEPLPLAAATAASSCGSSSCLDLGTIACCADLESCGNGLDDDCDTRVDEGCRCGDSDCGTARAGHGSADFCCTNERTCGQRDRLSKVDSQQCFDIQLEAKSDPEQCPDEVLDLGGGKQGVPGCCRADQRCGLSIGPLPCVPREQARYFVKAGTAVPDAKRCAF